MQRDVRRIGPARQRSEGPRMVGGWRSHKKKRVGGAGGEHGKEMNFRPLFWLF